MNRTQGTTILVIDNDLQARAYLSTVLKVHGFGSVLADSSEEALRLLLNWEKPVSLILLNLMSPGKAGLQTLKDIGRSRGDLPVILIYSKLSSPEIVESVDKDLVTCLDQPGPSELIKAIEAAMNRRILAPGPSPGFPFADGDGLALTRNGRMLEIDTLLRRVGPTDLPVILQGETGVGKQVLARQLHDYSARPHDHFQNVNCAAWPPERVENELFGWEPAELNTAKTGRPDGLERSRGRTILLDEIDELEPRLQLKLLQALQDGKFRRPRNGEITPVDFRIVAATRHDLGKPLRNGAFREELFYRLKVIHIQVPPLRERKDEIPWLADCFLKQHVVEHLAPPTVSPELLAALRAYDWPGNVRELENMMRKFALLRQPKMIGDDLKTLIAAQDEPLVEAPNMSGGSNSGASVLQEFQRNKQRQESEAILAALNASHWNRKQAAKLLRLDYKALLYKMKRLGIGVDPQ